MAGQLDVPVTPPCPNCGTIFTPGRSPAWHNTPVSIDTFDLAHGVEYRCNKCRHRWLSPHSTTYRYHLPEDLTRDEAP